VSQPSKDDWLPFEGVAKMRSTEEHVGFRLVASRPIGQFSDPEMRAYIIYPPCGFYQRGLYIGCRKGSRHPSLYLHRPSPWGLPKEQPSRNELISALALVCDQLGIEASGKFMIESDLGFASGLTKLGFTFNRQRSRTDGTLKWIGSRTINHGDWPKMANNQSLSGLDDLQATGRDEWLEASCRYGDSGLISDLKIGYKLIREGPVIKLTLRPQKPSTAIGRLVIGPLLYAFMVESAKRNRVNTVLQISCSSWPELRLCEHRYDIPSMLPFGIFTVED